MASWPEPTTASSTTDKDKELRKWCLERAFETRTLTGVKHMVVSNLADEYYRWIVFGETQGNRQLAFDEESEDAKEPLSVNGV